MKREIGIIGLGIMGGAMARNLAAAGWTVHGTDPNADALDTAGISLHPDAASLARAVPLLLTSLPSATALHAVAAAVAGSGAAPCTVIEASTMALEDKLAFEATLLAAGHAALDCPISGTGAQAVRRDLVVYASGEGATIAALTPLFMGFARAVHDLGAYGNGSRMKFVANLLVAVHNVASAEAMVLGMKAGLDPHQLVHLVGAGVGTSRVFDLRAPMMADDDYTAATMKIDVWQKDMSVIAAFARSLGAPTPLLSATAPIYDAAVAAGLGAQDTAAVCRILERDANLDRHRGLTPGQPTTTISRQ